MASIRYRPRKDGTVAAVVLFRHEGTQSTATFDDPEAAVRWKDILDRIGPAEALKVIKAEGGARHKDTTPLLSAWCLDHIDKLTGVEDGTRDKYRAYVRNDLDPTLGDLQISDIDEDVIANWVQELEEKGTKGKTIANKHGFLYAAMQRAVKRRPPLIAYNPCEGTNLPPYHYEPVFLEAEEFELVVGAMTERWRPLTAFLVMTGVRFSEATALRVGDVSAKKATCRVCKAWKYTGDSTDKLGTTKTRKSIRTIDLPAGALDVVDLKRKPGELLFPTRDGDRISSQLFHNRAWIPAMQKIGDQLNARPRPHDLRHTCASWMINKGVPLPSIQAHLGHEKISTTIDTYGHLDRRAGKVAADAITQTLDRSRDDDKEEDEAA